MLKSVTLSVLAITAATLLADAPGTAHAQGATGGGNAPAAGGPAASDSGHSTPTHGQPAQTSGGAGTGTSTSDKNGAGASLPNAVAKQAPTAPKS